MQFHSQYLPRVWFALLLCCVTRGSVALGDESKNAELAGVRACYDAYKKAILADDGKVAAEKVDKATIDYYGQMLQLTLKAPKKEVRGLPIVDKLMVIMIRHRVPADQVAKMDAAALFIHAVEQGWVGKQSIQRISLGEITIDGTKAVGVHELNGAGTEMNWQFYKEGGDWKINLTENMPAINKAFGTLVKQSGQSEDDFVKTILKITSGKTVSDEVWKPLQP